MQIVARTTHPNMLPMQNIPHYAASDYVVLQATEAAAVYHHQQSAVPFSTSQVQADACKFLLLVSFLSISARGSFPCHSEPKIFLEL